MERHGNSAQRATFGPCDVERTFMPAAAVSNRTPTSVDCVALEA